VRADVSALLLQPLTPVVLFLRDPREKVWGLLLSLDAAGITVRGLDLLAFEDWLRQQVKREDISISPLTLFYPLHRVERVERDESVGPLRGCADRYRAEVGESVVQALGLSPTIES